MKINTIRSKVKVELTVTKAEVKLLFTGTGKCSPANFKACGMSYVEAELFSFLYLSLKEYFNGESENV